MSAGGRRQGGFALLTVIFVMLVLGMVAAWLAEAISGRQAAVAGDVLQRQGDHAALAGVEWARAEALGGSCAAAQVAYAGFTVDVACATQQVDENGTLYDVFAVTADARHGAYGNPDFVRRIRRARFSNR
jgi:type II secretory pathway pseudopilin PulG